MKKMSKKELVEFLIENFTDENGVIDLSGLDFGDKIVSLNELKAQIIYQGGHQANGVYQSYQEATEIYQTNHKANKIYQGWHKAETIFQRYHEAKEIIQDNVKEK